MAIPRSTVNAVWAFAYRINKRDGDVHVARGREDPGIGDQPQEGAQHDVSDTERSIGLNELFQPTPGRQDAPWHQAGVHQPEQHLPPHHACPGGEW